jgi:hypothetical protein
MLLTQDAVGERLTVGSRNYLETVFSGWGFVAQIDADSQSENPRVFCAYAGVHLPWRARPATARQTR